LLIVSLSGPRRIVLAPDLLFRCTKFLVTGHIQPEAGHIQPYSFNYLKLNEFHV
jgi:hypothetical protein